MKDPGFDFWQEKDIFVSSIKSRLPLRLSQSPTQWMPESSPRSRAAEAWSLLLISIWYL